jgi:hypothetical protein
MITIARVSLPMGIPPEIAAVFRLRLLYLSLLARRDGQILSKFETKSISSLTLLICHGINFVSQTCVGSSPGQ